MVDLHHHLLPGLDDGSPDLATSVAMARAAAADGVTHVVCTPHASHRYAFQPDVVEAKLTELRAALRSENVSLQLGRGCDFHLSYDNVHDALNAPRRYTINGGDYLLVELPDFGIAQNLGETFYQLRVAGMTPILTHPERNPTLQRDLDRLAEWLRAGLLVQVTANSITGDMGRPAAKMAQLLLNKRWVHFVSSDAHNLRSRRPELSPARDLVARRHGAHYADLLFTENPLAVFDSRPLPPQEEPLALYDEQTGRPWWQRLFAR